MKKLLGFLVTALVMGQTLYGAATTQPYLSVNVLPQTPSFVSNSYMLTSLLSNNNGTVFVDVGSNDGAAARYMAQSAPAGTAVYNINAWVGGETSYQQFLSNVIQDNTDGIIVPIRMGWREAADATNLAADLIYINTDSPSTVTNTILGWFPHLNPNGILAGDNWDNPQIELAIISASSALGFTVNISGTFWWVIN